MRLEDLAPSAADSLRNASNYVADLLTPTLRLGVTGLSRSGKTVLITALIRNLVSGGRLPFFSPQADGRILRAYLEPQPDDAVPRFDYEAHLAALERDPPEWPQSTRRIAELRITIEYLAESRLRRALGPSRLHLDIVDYPGEWLIDLPLLEQSYETWSAEAAALSLQPLRAAAAKPWLDFLGRLRSLDPTEGPLDPSRNEQIALEGARAYMAYLKAARAGADRVSTLGPGRFLMPGDMEGSPLVTFFPLPPTEVGGGSRGTLQALLSRRYESYKTHVVRPFFRDHFSRIDRQIVLVDALGAVNAGPAAVQELERALAAVLKAFRPGTNSWLSALTGRRIDRLLFAATKADHLHHTSHDRLEAILRLITDRAIARASDAGADVRVMAMAALRATREAEAHTDNGRLPCIVGVPLPGEALGDEHFDGRTEAAIFPGDLPADPRIALEGHGQPHSQHDACFVRFRPPRLPRPGADGEMPALPHIRLDRALEFLISDRLP